MSRLADDALATQVRAALPETILGTPWDVRIVNHIEQSGADFYSGVVRVHETWLQSIHKTRLSYVTRHYPLAIGPFEEAEPQLVPHSGYTECRCRPVTAARAITIQRSFAGGQFTGALTVGEAFVARSKEGHDVFADRNCEIAIRGVMTAYHSRAWRRLADVRALADLRDRALGILTTIGSRRPYDADTCISLLPYDDLLPKAISGRLRYYEKLGIYPREGVPFPVLKQECADAVVVMQRDEILSLLLRLSFDISELQNSLAENRAASGNSISNGLTDEEFALLASADLLSQ
ncbi:MULTISPECIES: hypothetical protein [unclassified Bradyrhizobium]|uniref:hypothetical protein n=1 Tax=unclassified Bradyrhizobium TaxID=2631580 RepID=UPI00070AE555|nr:MULTISPECIES: hypothetical protein [unclassified Bradyrhizobium]KQT12901.1 hypothetical protein ASG57_08080 [Bradyrhizobium sp. Leaf396]